VENLVQVGGLILVGDRCTMGDLNPILVVGGKSGTGWWTNISG